MAVAKRVDSLRRLTLPNRSLNMSVQSLSLAVCDELQIGSHPCAHGGDLDTLAIEHLALSGKAPTEPEPAPSLNDRRVQRRTR